MTLAPADLPEHATLLAAVLFLMTKYAERECPGVRRAIALHLHWLAAHPSPELAAAQRRLYRQLAAQWEELDATAKAANGERRALVFSSGSYLQ